jgi:hypothetical protein
LDIELFDLLESEVGEDEGHMLPVIEGASGSG